MTTSHTRENACSASANQASFVQKLQDNIIIDRSNTRPRLLWVLKKFEGHGPPDPQGSTPMQCSESAHGIQCESSETFNGFPFFQANDKISSAKGVACVTTCSGTSKPVRNGRKGSMLNSLVWPPRSIVLAQKRSQKQSNSL